MKKYLINFIKENEKSLKLMVIIFLTSIIIGIFSFAALDTSSKEDIIKSIQVTMDLAKNEEFKGVNILINGFTSYIILALIFFFSAFTIITPIILCIYLLIKGFSIGCFIVTLNIIFGTGEGIIVNTLITIIPNIILIPIIMYLIIMTVKLEFSLTNRNKDKSKIKSIVEFCMRYITTFPLYFLSLLIEQILFKIVLNMYCSM